MAAAARPKALCLLLLLAAYTESATASDPAPSWLVYVAYRAPGPVTRVACNWEVPDKPTEPFGSNAPGWWFGVQTARGDGALIQPILAYGFKGAHYSIFNGVFDWTDESWRTSDTQTVAPGDRVTSDLKSVDSDDRTYDMSIARQGDKPIVTRYRLEDAQKDAETVVYFVLEHQPITCLAYPRNGKLTFANITVEVSGKVVDEPAWEVHAEQPACGSTAAVADARTLAFTWDPHAQARPPAHPSSGKWRSFDAVAEA